MRPEGSCGPSTAASVSGREGHRRESGAAGPRERRCPDSGRSGSPRGSGRMKTALVLGFTPGRLGAVSRAPHSAAVLPYPAAVPGPSPAPAGFRGVCRGAYYPPVLGFGDGLGQPVRRGREKRGRPPRPSPSRRPLRPHASAQRTRFGRQRLCSALRVGLFWSGGQGTGGHRPGPSHACGREQEPEQGRQPASAAGCRCLCTHTQGC